MPVLKKTNNYILLKILFHLLVGEQGATYSNIICGNITTCIWRTEGVITWSQPGHTWSLPDQPGHYLVTTWSLPGKFAHLYDFSIRSFDCMVCYSFHTLSWHDFRSNLICPPINKMLLHNNKWEHFSYLYKIIYVVVVLIRMVLKT